jgi:hypothetical protein
LIADCFVLSQFQHGQHRQVSNSRGSLCSKTRAYERHEAIACVRVQLYASSCFDILFALQPTFQKFHRSPQLPLLSTITTVLTSMTNCFQA